VTSTSLGYYGLKTSCRMKYLEPVSLAFRGEAGQGYVLKEGGVCYSDIYRCFKCITVDVERAKLREKFFNGL